MTTSWPEPVERVAAYLRAAAAEGRVEELSAETPTAQAAADAVGCSLPQIVKSLVLVGESGAYFMALVPGDRRADLAKIAGAVGAAKLRVAKPDEVLDATGFSPGAVAPFPVPRVTRIVADRSVLAQRVVWIGAGSTRHLACLPPSELVRLSRADTVDVVQVPEYHSQSEAETKES
jgi:prolyl-tRNA editing enzyme YbaK/EbsC (Cys-tRNA(Pro) deacylase)